jgi:hypothetical protein
MRTIEKHRRIERRQRLESRESSWTPYNLRKTMGRRGVNSSRGTCRGSKGEKTFDVSVVAPIVLFPVSEEENPVDKGGSEVIFMCITKDVFLIEIAMFNSIMESGDTLNFFVVCEMLSAPLCCCYLRCRNMNWLRFLEQGMTQTELQPGAASSASTSVHSEQQVCEYCVKMVIFRVRG